MAEALKMAMMGLGRSAYGQIGSMLEKFYDTFKNVFGDKEDAVDIGTIDVTEEDMLAAQILLELGYDSSEASHIRRFQGDFNTWRTAWSKPINITEFEMTFGVESPAMRELARTAPRLELNGVLDENTRHAASDADYVEGVMAGAVDGGDWMGFIQFSRNQLAQA
jgi:hypothetical protein